MALSLVEFHVEVQLKLRVKQAREPKFNTVGTREATAQRMLDVLMSFRAGFVVGLEGAVAALVGRPYN